MRGIQQDLPLHFLPESRHPPVVLKPCHPLFLPLPCPSLNSRINQPIRPQITTGEAIPIHVGPGARLRRAGAISRPRRRRHARHRRAPACLLRRRSPRSPPQDRAPVGIWIRDCFEETRLILFSNKQPSAHREGSDINKHLLVADVSTRSVIVLPAVPHPSRYARRRPDGYRQRP